MSFNPNGIRERIETVKGNVADAVGGATDAVGGVVHDLSAGVPSASDVRSAARRGAGIVAENPLGLVLGALAAGALVGLLMPVTDYERERVGPIRDDLVGRAGAIGADALQHGRSVLNETAQTAVQTAQQAVRTQGTEVLNGELTPEALAANVVSAGKTILHDTLTASLQTAQQSAQTHGRAVVAEAQGQPHTD